MILSVSTTGTLDASCGTMRKRSWKHRTGNGPGAALLTKYRSFFVVYTAAWAALFNTEVEATCRKCICRRDRDCKYRNRENLVLEFVDRFVAFSNTRHYKTMRIQTRCRLTVTLQRLQRSKQRRWSGHCLWPAAGLAPTPPPCSSLLMASSVSTLGCC